MTRPWMQFHTRDWLDNKELRRCSPVARAVLADLMCLAHEGKPYGYLSDDIGTLAEQFMAARCVVTVKVFRAALVELLSYKRIEMNELGCMFIPRMVRDEEIRLKRAAGGEKSIGHPNTHPPIAKEGYPSTNPSLAEKGDHSSCVSAHGRSDSDSGCDSFLSSPKKSGKKKTPPAEVDEWFEIQFWPIWVNAKNDSKAAALVAFRSKVKTHADVQAVVSGVNRQRKARQAEDPKYRSHAATWLNQGRWIDAGDSEPENAVLPFVHKPTPSIFDKTPEELEADLNAELQRHRARR
jgi:hypothetical protein